MLVLLDRCGGAEGITLVGMQLPVQATLNSTVAAMSDLVGA